MPTYMQRPVSVEIVPLEPLRYFQYKDQPEWVRAGIRSGRITPGKTHVTVVTDKKGFKHNLCDFSDYIMLNPDGTFNVISKAMMEELFDKVMSR